MLDTRATRQQQIRNKRLNLAKSAPCTGPPKRTIPVGEVIEISSDSEAEHDAAIIADLQEQVKELQQENLKVKEDMKEAENVARLQDTKSKEDHARLLREYGQVFREKMELELAINATKDKILLDANQIEETISCEICSGKMWMPCVLPDCGHTFCQSCLQEWLSTTLNRHKAEHANRNVQIPAHVQDLMRNPWAQAHQRLLIAPFIPQPLYTCPTCRKQVNNRPVEDFTLKSLVRIVSAATGESSPKKENQVKAHGPWDNFFNLYIT